MSPQTTTPAARMPCIFMGHGSPMNALEDNRYTQAWRALAHSLPRPKAVLCVSAHWHIPGVGLTSGTHPQTIHDFGGFPPALHAAQYPAPGDDALVARCMELLRAHNPRAKSDWGLDHGAWSVLAQMYPNADIPVVQLSMSRSFSPAEHMAVGAALRPLRSEGVLIMGSGNITHNLRHAMSSGPGPTPPWAARFDAECTHALATRDTDFLLRAPETAEGRMAHPTSEHYLPLLYVAGASSADEPVRFLCEGMEWSSLSMRSVVFG